MRAWKHARISGAVAARNLLYLCPRRAEERAQHGTVSNLRHSGAIFGLHGQVSPLKSKNGRVGDENKAGRVRFYLFERQLHILFVVIVVDVLSEVMHGEEVGESNFPVERLVLGKMFEQQRHPVHLAQRSSIQDDYK